LYLYPRIIGIHNLGENDCISKEGGLFSMPANVRPSVSSIDEGGVYLVFNGQGLLLWIHKYVSPVLLHDLFGDHVKALTDLDPYMNELPEIETVVSHKARALVNYFVKKSGQSFLAIQLARQGMDGAEYEFTSMLVEDGNLGHYNYQDYVTHIHRNVKLHLENKGNKSSLLSEAIALSPAAI
jgi:protein transport protein SEC24